MPIGDKIELTSLRKMSLENSYSDIERRLFSDEFVVTREFSLLSF